MILLLHIISIVLTLSYSISLINAFQNLKLNTRTFMTKVLKFDNLIGMLKPLKWFIFNQMNISAD